MGNIHVLDISVANLIAAGEVVDRPASAIKEMMENSIDAGAKEITVEVRNGGSSFMRVTDDGCGMDEEDARSCIQRHATSKIRNQADLDSIMTLGFRGEALAAIASVSDFRILTRRHGQEMGTLLRCEAGRVIECVASGCPEGTTIIAENLFANIPARRKFLKKDISETAAVVATVEKIALSHPEISVRLITDGNLKFHTAGDGKLANAIYAVLGRDFAKKLVPVKDMTDGIGVMGYIGRPDNVRGNRNYQNFFINGRYIKSATATAALEQAFVSYCPSEKFPCCVLNLEIHPTLVDVNVHPAKLEVKFSNEKMVFHAVYCAVRNALSQSLPRPEAHTPQTKATGDDLKGLGDLITYKAETAEAARQMSLDRDKLTVPYRQIGAFDAPIDLPAQKTTMTQEIEEAVNTPSPSVTPLTVPSVLPTIDKIDLPATVKQPIETDEQAIRVEIAEISEETGEKTILGYAWQLPFDENDIHGEDLYLKMLKEAASDPSEKVENGAEEIPCQPERTTLPHYTLGGVLFQCYVVVQLDDCVILIDKHAAHERILFETLKENQKKGQSAYQMLLIPILVSPTPTERGACEEYADQIRGIGFDFKIDPDTQNLLLTQIPCELDRSCAADTFITLLGALCDGTASAESTRDAIYEKALFQASCKAAVKAGREDNEGHIRWIVEQTLTNPRIRFCPHGRPVALEMTKSQVEHLFHRP